MVSALGGALGGQLAVLPLEGGQLQFLEVMLQSSVDLLVMPPSPARGPCSPWRWWSSRSLGGRYG